MTATSALRPSPEVTGPALRRITYSPKVFIPLTMLCRDRCGYCTFAQSPAHLPAPYLSIDEVLDVARAGAEAGCHEALFTLGESPEDRYPVAREWLDAHGFASTVEYLAARRAAGPRRDRPPAACERRGASAATSWPPSDGCPRARG